MNLFLHLLATLLTVFAGFGVLVLLRRPGLAGRSLWEQLGLAYLVGLTVISVEILVLSHLIKISLPLLLGLQIPLIALLFARVKFWGGPALFQFNTNRRSLFSNTWWQWILIALIAVKLFYVLVMNLSELRRTDDAFTYALSLAKHTYFAGSHVDFRMPRDYPRIPGLGLAWFAWVRGGWDEFALNLPFFNYYAAFLMLFYANLRAIAGKSAALIGAYILSALPLLLNHAVLIGYADLPMALFLCFAGVYAYRYARDGHLVDLLLAGFFTLALPLIKTEGKIPYLFIALFIWLAALLLRRGRARPAAIWAAAGGGLVLAAALLTVLSAIYGDREPPFLPPNVWPRIRPGNHWAEIRQPLLAHFGSAYNNWMVLGTLCPFALVPLAIRFARRAECIIMLYGLLLLASYIYLFCIGGAYSFLVNGTTVNRAYLQILPVMLFCCVVGLTAATARPGEKAPAP